MKIYHKAFAKVSDDDRQWRRAHHIREVLNIHYTDGTAGPTTVQESIVRCLEDIRILCDRRGINLGAILASLDQEERMSRVTSSPEF